VERPGQTCVMTTGYAARKLEPDGVHAGPDLERVVDEFAPRWVVRSFPVARQILRASDATDQAGFGAGGISLSKMRPPILYQEGSQHRPALHEILRLEPVVGKLRRTTRKPVDVQTADGPVTIPPGERIELQLRRANADPDVVGQDPDRLCPDRTWPAAVPSVVLSFGDGHHRCPGGPLAILESDIFLHRLLARDLITDGPPRVRWNTVSQGYDLDRFMVRLRD
jgi:hypothetical protein